jgi:ATP-dependent DNA helicase PIF1
MELSLEQQIVFDKYIAGYNIFITGPGGSGKSAIIRQIYKHAYSSSKKIYVTALTGCAAVLLNCQAKTIHSWAGIGLGTQSIENLVKKIKNTLQTKLINIKC